MCRFGQILPCLWWGGRRYQDRIPVNGTRDIELSAQSETSPRSSSHMLNHLMGPPTPSYAERMNLLITFISTTRHATLSSFPSNTRIRNYECSGRSTSTSRMLLPSSISQHRRKTTAGIRNASYGTADYAIDELDDPEANMKHPNSVLARRFSEHILAYRCVHPHRRSDTPLEFKRSLGPRVYARPQRVGHSALWATTVQHRRQEPTASRFTRRSRSEASSTPSMIFEP
jgi:hypothetical protein